jgi:hypothetical protein
MPGASALRLTFGDVAMRRPACLWHSVRRLPLAVPGVQWPAVPVPSKQRRLDAGLDYPGLGRTMKQDVSA